MQAKNIKITQIMIELGSPLRTSQVHVPRHRIVPAEILMGNLLSVLPPRQHSQPERMDANKLTAINSSEKSLKRVEREQASCLNKLRPNQDAEEP